LKRYAAAATDARRAVALAPTFGKAHARLGQSLYFLKDYEGAVAAYEEALDYEPDNAVTQTYLEKAKRKLAKQQEKASRQARGEEISLADESVPFTVANSVATDPNKRSAVVQTGFRGSSKAIMNAVKGTARPVDEVSADRNAANLISPLGDGGANEPEDDPDFEEALRIQQFANKMLQSKRYKEAIEEYSAALFLVPDDPYLSPELHLGRAHALNGARRHESARNDAQLAIKMQPSSEAYSTLAKSLFYMEDYYGSVEAFEQCIDLLPPGESLSMFDQAYLSKAEAAWNEEMRRNPEDARSTISARSTSVPKLPPPRFVPREVVRHCWLLHLLLWRFHSWTSALTMPKLLVFVGNELDSQHATHAEGLAPAISSVTFQSEGWRRTTGVVHLRVSRYQTKPWL
jgi:tetratricopeptide (TPR) repeat protein